MTLRIQAPIIRNLRNHSWQEVEELRALLDAGASARPDPRRKNFYELDGGSRTFYIHLTPATRKIMLLAVWRNVPPAESAAAREAALAACCAAS